MQQIARNSLFFWVLLVAAALGGCHYYTETIPEKDTEDPLIGIWTLVAMQRPGAAEERVAPEPPYTLEFATSSRLAGRADCNRYFGGYEADKGRIKVLAVGATRAACPPESISDEFLKMVGAATQYEIRNAQLRLSGADGSALAFVRQEALR
ncbi:MAG: META domain-containing protein [Steroidobacteraceae bacterium]